MLIILDIRMENVVYIVEKLCKQDYIHIDHNKEGEKIK